LTKARLFIGDSDWVNPLCEDGIQKYEIRNSLAVFHDLECRRDSIL